MSKPQHFETLALHAGQSVDPVTHSRAVPIYRTSAYTFRDTEHAANLFGLKELGNIYTRLMNPTQDVLEKRIAALEGGAAALTAASGTAAIFNTVINVCRAGDEVIAARNLYGGTYTMFDTILPQLGIKVHLIDPEKIHELDHLVNAHTRLLFAETISNPSLEVVDLDAFAAFARKHHLPFAVDSTFSTPYLNRPIEFGANIVIHSLTKWLGGHGTGIGGIVVDAANFDWKDPKFSLFNEPDESYHGLRYAHDLGELSPLAFILRMRLVPLRNLGACIAPDNAWLFLQGVETLPLRMQRHSDNALAVAEALSKHPKVSWVKYPGLPSQATYARAKKYLSHGFGGMVVFGIKGGDQEGRKFIEKLRLLSHLANVGDAKSLAIHPYSTTHAQLSEEQKIAAGATPDLIRLSIGIEHIDDILEDIHQALEA
jgi:O-acetylhomoserine (thiol)-lyase